MTDGSSLVRWPRALAEVAIACPRQLRQPEPLHRIVAKAMDGAPLHASTGRCLFAVLPLPIEAGGDEADRDLLLVRSPCLPASLQAMARPVELPDAGSTRGFSLTACATRSSGGRHIPLAEMDKCRAWLDARAGPAGFALLEVTAAPLRFGFLDLVRFAGRLRVDDEDAFARTLAFGLGKSRAYGAGMMITIREERP